MNRIAARPIAAAVFAVPSSAAKALSDLWTLAIRFVGTGSGTSSSLTEEGVVQRGVAR